MNEENFKTNKPFSITKWKYAVKVPEVKEVELTVQEIEELLEEKLGKIKLKIII